MAEERTDRYALPLLQAGQAQKELTHNEAIVLLDMLTMAAAAGVANAPPVAPAPGDCWIIGTAPTGEWAAAAQMLALWTQNGWRFVLPREGMRVWISGENCTALWRDGTWEIGTVHGRRVFVEGEQVIGARGDSIPAPVGGATIDVEAREGLAAIVRALAVHGLIAES